MDENIKNIGQEDGDGNGVKNDTADSFFPGNSSKKKINKRSQSSWNHSAFVNLCGMHGLMQHQATHQLVAAVARWLPPAASSPLPFQMLRLETFIQP